jgi:hypothetical protein
MSNMIMTTRQQTFVSLMRLQALGVTDTEIKNTAQLMTFDSMLIGRITIPIQQTTAGFWIIITRKNRGMVNRTEGRIHRAD